MHSKRGRTITSRGGDSEDEYNVSLSDNNNDRELGINGHPTCGNYCKFLTPDQERAIVLQCVRESIENYFFEQNFILTDIDAEISKIASGNVSLNLITAKLNDKRYLICANWWREWCDYANFDLS